MKTYVLDIEVEQDEDGTWTAEVPYFPGCAVEGYTREQAIEALREGAQAMLEVMLEHGDPIPAEVERRAVMTPAEVVTITL